VVTVLSSTASDPLLGRPAGVRGPQRCINQGSSACPSELIWIVWRRGLPGMEHLALATFPFIVLATLYWYYFQVFATGLIFRHGAHNYRDAFKAYAACINPPG
jgi:hypothetical protein